MRLARRRATQQHTWQENPQFPSTFGFDARGVMSCLDLGECKLHRLTGGPLDEGGRGAKGGTRLTQDVTRIANI